MSPFRSMFFGPLAFARSVCLALCLYATAHSPQARANGRPPNATGIAVDSQDANRLIAAVTFGAIVSTDGGLNWHWVCEQVLGGPSGVDAQVAITADGTFIVANPNGLFTATDAGCTWVPRGHFGSPQQTTRLALHPTDAATWLLTVNNPDVNSGSIYRTTNAGTSFTALPTPPPQMYLYSVVFAPTDASRLYAGGSNNASNNSAYLFRSDDGGSTWSSSLVVGAPAASAQTRVAVSPINKDVILVGANDVALNSAAVLRSTDGGATWAAVTTLPGPLRDITFSTDATQVWVASTHHIERSIDGGVTFTPLTAPTDNACVIATQQALYACGSEASGDSFALGRSTDGGTTWQDVVDLTQIQGPFSCESDTNNQSICMPLWPDEATAIGAPIEPVLRLPNSGTTQNTTSTHHTPSKGGCACQSLDTTASLWGLLAGFGWHLRRRASRKKRPHG